MTSTSSEEKSCEPELKASREENSSEMQDAQWIEVCEFYSMPRVAPKAISTEIKKGPSFDVGTVDPKGKSWDLTSASQRQQAREYVSPCDRLSIMQYLKN